MGEANNKGRVETLNMSDYPLYTPPSFYTPGRLKVYSRMAGPAEDEAVRGENLPN